MPFNVFSIKKFPGNSGDSLCLSPPKANLAYCLRNRALVGRDDRIHIDAPAERGAQLSVMLKPRMLDSVLHHLEKEGAVVDERKPDVLRIAPAPLYNTFRDVHDFIGIFHEACGKALAKPVEAPKHSEGVPEAIKAT